MKPNPVFASLILIAIGISFFSGCQSRTAVEVVDLNKVLDIYDRAVKSKEDPELANSETANSTTANSAAANSTTEDKPTTEENAEDTKAFLKLFADELNKASLIKSTIGVDIQVSGIIRGFVDRDKNGSRDLSGSNEPLLFTIEFDKQGERVIATQTVAGQQYRRDHHYGSGYRNYYYFHHMRNSMWSRQNSYYSSSRPQPNYSGLSMSSPNYHTAAVSKAQAASRASSRSSARGSSGSRSFSSGK